MTTDEVKTVDPLASVFEADGAHEAARLAYEEVSETADGAPVDYLTSIGSAVVRLQEATDNPEFPLQALELVPLSIAAGQQIHAALVNGGKAGKFVPSESTWFRCVNPLRRALPRFSREAIARPRHIESVAELIKQSVGPQQIALITGLDIALIKDEISKPGSASLPEPADYPAAKQGNAAETNDSMQHLERLGELRLVARLLRSVGCV